MGLPRFWKRHRAEPPYSEASASEPISKDASDNKSTAELADVAPQEIEDKQVTTQCCVEDEQEIVIDIDALETSTPESEPKHEDHCCGPRLRIGCVLLVMIGTPIVLNVTGLMPEFHKDQIKHLVIGNPFGPVLFCAAFSIGELIHIPGLVFVAAAVFACGHLLGAALAYAGSLCSISLGFLLTRFLAGNITVESLGLPACVVNSIQKLEEKPIRTIACLRCCFYLAPNFNTFMAITNVEFRQYFLGSAIALVPLTLLVTFLLDKLIHWGFA